MTAIEEARAVMAWWEKTGAAPHRNVAPAINALRALIEEHERLIAPPTDDEREALAEIVTYQTFMDATPYQEADAILAAGFRRPGPITDAQVDAGAWALLSHHMDLADKAPSEAAWEEARCDVRAALEAARDA